jgi:hypothetical protein
MSEPIGIPARTGPAPSVDTAVPSPVDDYQAAPVPPPAADGGGLLRFAGLVLGLTGVWQVVAGLVALLEPDRLLVTAAALPLRMSYTGWGWTHLVVGVVALLCCVGVLARNRLASVVAVVLAVVSAAVNLVFMRAEPFWSVMIIALDLLVIWGVTAQAPPPRRAR